VGLSMRVTKAFVLLVIGFLIVVAISLLRRPEERLATLADEGRTGTACSP